MARSVHVQDAVDGYMQQRAREDVGRAQLAAEAAMLADFIRANGNIWLSQAGTAASLERCEREGVDRASLVALLDDMHDWSRGVGYLPNSADLLVDHREPGRRRPERFRGGALGRCRRCRFAGLVFRLRIEDVISQETLSIDLCFRCVGRLTLDVVLPSRSRLAAAPGRLTAQGELAAVECSRCESVEAVATIRVSLDAIGRREDVGVCDTCAETVPFAVWMPERHSKRRRKRYVLTEDEVRAME